MAVFCKLCGAELMEGKKFCPSCGSPVEGAIQDQVPERDTNSSNNNSNPDEFKKINADEFIGSEAGRFSGKSEFEEFTQNVKLSPKVEEAIGESPIMGIISMILGIISMLCCCWFGFLGLIISGAAIVLGILSIKRKEKNSGMAVAGIICGSIGLLLCIFMGIFSLIFSSALEKTGENFGKFMNITSLEELKEAIEEFVKSF